MERPGLGADTTKMTDVQRYIKDFQQLAATRPQLAFHGETGGDSSGRRWPVGSLAAFRWMTEEYRVSLFAQQLGTKIPVSAKRLDKMRDSFG